MLKPEKYGIEMTEVIGITGNEPCLVLIAAVWKRKYCSAIFPLPDCFYNLLVVPFNKKHQCFFVLAVYETSYPRGLKQMQLSTDYPCTIKLSASQCGPFLD